MKKKHYVFQRNPCKKSIFDENPCGFLVKTCFFFTGSAAAVKNVKIEQICLVFLSFFAFLDLAEAFASAIGNPAGARIIAAALTF